MSESPPHPNEDATDVADPFAAEEHAQPTPGRRAEGLPDWDLLPPTVVVRRGGGPE